MKNNFKVKVNSKWVYDIAEKEVLNLDGVKVNGTVY